MVVFMNKADAVDDAELLELVETGSAELLSAMSFLVRDTGDQGLALKALEGDPEWRRRGRAGWKRWTLIFRRRRRDVENRF